jgi:hypothetical protein
VAAADVLLSSAGSTQPLFAAAVGLDGSPARGGGDLVRIVAQHEDLDGAESDRAIGAAAVVPAHDEQVAYRSVRDETVVVHASRHPSVQGRSGDTTIATSSRAEERTLSNPVTRADGKVTGQSLSFRDREV